MDHTKPLSFWEKFGPLPRLLRLKTVLLITGLARSTIYRMIAEHRFPAPVKIGKRAVAWRQEDVRQWRESLSTVSAA
jgi:prophage regulatory protein